MTSCISYGPNMNTYIAITSNGGYLAFYIAGAVATFDLPAPSGH